MEHFNPSLSIQRRNLTAHQRQTLQMFADQQPYSRVLVYSIIIMSLKLLKRRRWVFLDDCESPALDAIVAVS